MTESRLHRILIVGGGIGGLTLAALLKNENLEIEIAERAPAWAPVGAGITLGLNAMGVLDRIGLRRDAESRGRVMSVAKITDEKGNVLAEADFSQLAPKFGQSIAIHRAQLHECLASAVGNARVRFGAEMTAIEQHPGSVIASFGDGTTGSYDLVVGADGIRSVARRAVSRDDAIDYSGYTCWRFMVEGEFGADFTAEMWGRGKRFGVVPLPGKLVYCFATLNAPAGDPEMKRISVARFRKTYSEFGWAVPKILEAIQNESQLIHNDLEEVKLDRWVRDRVVLLGDAAHAMTPNMGQGAAMAMEDAVVLAREIAEVARGAKPLEEALDAYQQRRWKRVQRVQEQSFRIGRAGQMSSPILCSVRNAVLSMTPNRVMIANVVKLLSEPV